MEKKSKVDCFKGFPGQILKVFQVFQELWQPCKEVWECTKLHTCKSIKKPSSLMLFALKTPT